TNERREANLSIPSGSSQRRIHPLSFKVCRLHRLLKLLGNFFTHVLDKSRYRRCINSPISSGSFPIS
ncbi:hypothetical protein GIB67_002484, partial [Kingdonia uniflora]